MSGDQNVPDSTPLPEGSVIISPQQQFDMLLNVRDELKHLSSIMDPELARVRESIATNSARIDIESAERKASHEVLAERTRKIETAGYVTGTRMWVVAVAVAGMVAAAVTVLTYVAGLQG